MIKQTITQAALSLKETFNDTKNKFKTWTDSIEPTALIFGQDTLHIAFSKMTSSSLSSANRLKTQSPNLRWTDHK